MSGPTGGAYSAPRPPSWILGVGAGKGAERKGGEKERKEGRDHPNKMLVTGLEFTLIAYYPH